MNIIIDREEIMRWEDVFRVLSLDAAAEFWEALGLHSCTYGAVREVSRDFEERYRELQDRSDVSPEAYGEHERQLVESALLELERRLGEQEASFFLDWGRHVSTLREQVLGRWADVFEAFGELDDSARERVAISQPHLSQLREMIRTGLGPRTLEQIEQIERFPVSEWDKSVRARWSEGCSPLDAVLAFVLSWQTKLIGDYMAQNFSNAEFIALTRVGEGVLR